MAQQMQLNREHTTRDATVLDDAVRSAPVRDDHHTDESCPRCGSVTVRTIVYGPLDFEVEAVEVTAFLDEAPIFDCRECGFEWGLAVRDLLA